MGYYKIRTFVCMFLICSLLIVYSFLNNNINLSNLSFSIDHPWSKAIIHQHSNNIIFERSPTSQNFRIGILGEPQGLCIRKNYPRDLSLHPTLSDTVSVFHMLSLSQQTGRQALKAFMAILSCFFFFLQKSKTLFSYAV